MIDKIIEYCPLGSAQPIKLNRTIVLNNLVRPTRSGHLPSEQELMKYLMICRSLMLNPFLDECYLIGYEDKYQGVVWRIQTGHNTFIKRAAMSPNYRGHQPGCIGTRNGETRFFNGAYLDPDWELYGGFCFVYRQNCAKMEMRVMLRSWNKGINVWQTIPELMIMKVAEGHALRKAFPGNLHGLYQPEETPDIIVDEEVRGGQLKRPKFSITKTEEIEETKYPGPKDDDESIEPEETEPEEAEAESEPTQREQTSEEYNILKLESEMTKAGISLKQFCAYWVEGRGFMAETVGRWHKVPPEIRDGVLANAQTLATTIKQITEWLKGETQAETEADRLEAEPNKETLL